MRQSTTRSVSPILWVLLLVLAFLIVCPLVSVFAEAVIIDGRLDLYRAWTIIADPENLQTIWNSLLLGVCVVALSTVIAAPTAYLLARSQLGKHKWLDIVFMVPFMTPALHRVDGLDPVHAAARAVPAAVPLHRPHLGRLLLLRRAGAGHDAERVPLYDDDLEKRHPEHPRQPGGERRRVRCRVRSAAAQDLRPLLTGNYAIAALLVFVKTLSEYGHPLYPWPAHRILCLYYRYSPLRHHRAGGLW